MTVIKADQGERQRQKLTTDFNSARMKDNYRCPLPAAQDDGKNKQQQRQLQKQRQMQILRCAALHSE